MTDGDKKLILRRYRPAIFKGSLKDQVVSRRQAL